MKIRAVLAATLALLCSGGLAAAQTALSPPTLAWGTTITTPQPVQTIGYDSATSSPCIVGKTPTCSQVATLGPGSSITPLTVTTVDRAGAITVGGTAQDAIPANAARKSWCIQNPPTATEVLYVRAGGAATTTSGAVLTAGAMACSQAELVDQGAISVLAATTAHAYLGFEKQ